jgi:hypothetical protein
LDPVVAVTAIGAALRPLGNTRAGATLLTPEAADFVISEDFDAPIPGLLPLAASPFLPGTGDGSETSGGLLRTTTASFLAA